MNQESPPAHAGSTSAPRTPRIVSAVHAAIEWLEAFGAGDRVVGRSHARTDLAPLASLAADVVVVASDDEARLLASTAPRAEAFVFAPRTLKQILDRALALGHLAGVAREAMAWIADAERRLALAQRRVGVMKRATARPRVVILHGDDVLLSGGYWCADLIELAGGHPVLTESGDPPKPVTADGVRAARPDLVVLAPLSSADLEERLGADVAVRRLPEEVEVLGPGPGVYRTVDVILEAVGRARTRR